MTFNRIVKKKAASLLGLFLIASIMFGCDPAGLARFKMPADDFSGTSKVSGTVTINGMPLEAAKIVFVPEKLLDGLQSFRPLAYATTDSLGVYSVALGDGSQEIPVGRYRVLISKRGNKIPQPPQAENPQIMALLNPFALNSAVPQSSKNETSDDGVPSANLAENAVAIQLANFDGTSGLFEALPAKFNRESALTVTVEAGGAETKIDFKLLIDGE